MANERKRITYQTADGVLVSGDYVMVDSETEGTRKFDLGSTLTDLKSDLGDLSELETEDKSSLVNAINEARGTGGSGGDGLTQTEKNLVLALFSKAAYTEDDASETYDELAQLWGGYSITWSGSGYSKSNAETSVSSGASFTSTVTADTGFTLTDVTVTMGGTTVQGAWSNGRVTIPSVTGNVVITVTTSQVTVTSISAVYTQSGTVYDTTALDDLKTDLVVTATFVDSSTGVINANDYTLSGTLATGTSTITVAYGGKTTTFNVTVSAAPGTGWVSGVPYDMTDGLTENMYLNNGVETAYNGWSISPYLQCSGAFFMTDKRFTYNAEYDENGNYVNKQTFDANILYNLDDRGVSSFRVSAATSDVTTATITPYRLDSLGETTVYDTSKYYVPTTWNNGAYINVNNGNIVSNGGYKYSDYMNCYNATTITDNLYGLIRGYCFYDGDKNFISGIEIGSADSTTHKETTIPSSARFFRCFSTNDKNGLCFKLS